MHKWLILFSFISLSAFAKNKNYSFSISNSTSSNLKMNSSAELFVDLVIIWCEIQELQRLTSVTKPCWEMKLNFGNLVLGMSYPTKLEPAAGNLVFHQKQFYQHQKVQNKFFKIRI